MYAPQEVWPMSVAGWLGIILSAIAIFGAVWGYAKSAARASEAQRRMVEQLNGMGERMKRLEDAHEQHRGMMEKLDRAVESTLRAQGELLVRIGAAEKHSEDAEDRTVQLGIDIGSRLSDLAEKLGQFRSDITNRMTELTVELRTRGLIGPEATKGGANR